MTERLELHEGEDDDPISQQAVDTLAAASELPGMSTFGLTKGVVRAEFEQLDTLYGELQEIAEMPNRSMATRRAEALNASISSKGTLAAALLPSMSAILNKRNETLDDIQNVVSTLDQIAEGRTPRSTNAAWWWIRAGAIARQADGPWQDDPEAAAAVEELLAEADALTTATYPEVIEGYAEPLVPWWLSDQDLLASGLLRRMDTAAEQGDAAAATRDLERLIRMTAAMGNARSIAASLAGLSIAERLTPAAEQLAPTMSPANRSQLEQWTRTISTRDPLGLLVAATSTRERLQKLVPVDFTDALVADIPADDAGLLSMVSWLRGRAEASRTPRIFIAPGGEASDAPLAGLDATRLGAWADVGGAEEQPAGFAELGGEDISGSSATAAELLTRLRIALRH